MTKKHNDPAPVVSFKDVCFYYGSKLVFDRVNFTVDPTGVTCVVGPNGSGKTTLLKLMIGMEVPSRGKISILGMSPRLASHKVGHMPQAVDYEPSFPITVLDVVLMGRLHNFSSWYKKQDLEYAKDILNKLDLFNVMNDSFSKLSGGQKRRILLARALVCNPSILVLDEPTANLDAKIENKIMEIINELSSKMAVLLVSHDPNFVAGMVKKVICVHNQHVAIHPTNEVTKKSLFALYQNDVKMVDHDCSIEGHCQDE